MRNQVKIEQVDNLKNLVKNKLNKGKTGKLLKPFKDIGGLNQ